MSNLEGYDSVALTSVEWRAIVPESAGYEGVIGSYGNGRFANTSAAKAAFPKARHIVYDVNGSMPACDILDVEPGDASPPTADDWARAHNSTADLSHVMPHPGLYCSASTTSTVISVMLDAGFERSDFLIHSAHYGKGQHVCGPATCGFPQADGTQYADKGLRGQNTDLNVFLPHFFAAPAPDPDARYGLFDGAKRTLIGRNTERATVQEYDKWRATQTRTKHPHRVRLALLRVRLRLLAGRLKRVIGGEKDPHPNQVWRLRELQDRAQGMRLV